MHVVPYRTYSRLVGRGRLLNCLKASRRSLPVGMKAYMMRAVDYVEENARRLTT